MAPQAPPVSVDLRPLTTGELIDRGFSLYRQHFAGLLLLALLSQAGPLLVQVLTTVLHLMPTEQEVALAAPRTVVNFGGFILLVLLSQLIAFVFDVIMTRYVADAYLGREPSVTASFRSVGGKLAGSIWTCLLIRFFYLLTLIFPFLAALAVEVWYVDAPPASFAGLVFMLGGGGLLAVASLVPVLVVVMRLMTAVPALALENLSGWTACRRSSALVRFDPGQGFFYWGETRLSLLLLPLFVIQILTSTLTSVPMVIAQINDLIRHGATPALTNYPDVVVVGSQVLTYLAGALILPLYTIAVTLFYYDVRIRREGFDLEFLAARLETIGMRRMVAILFGILALGLNVRADDAAPVIDPTVVSAHYHKVAARPEFHETEETLGDLHWTDWLGQWIRHLVARFEDFKYVGQLSGTARVMVVILTGLAVVGLIVLLTRLTRRKRERDLAEADELLPGRTLLTPRQYEKRLRAAVTERDWHGAWLAAWLQFLARLENRHLVEPDRSRTNREYLNQLHSQKLPAGALPLLTRMVDDYDRTIYGRRPIDEAGWAAFRDRIDELTLQLGLRDPATEEPA